MLQQSIVKSAFRIKHGNVVARHVAASANEIPKLLLLSGWQQQQQQHSSVLLGSRRQLSDNSDDKSSTFPEVSVEHGRESGVWKTYGGANNYNPGKFQIETFNKISKSGLGRFQSENYEIYSGEEKKDEQSHAILLRSYKLKEEEVKQTVRAIARCGAGTNNVPVDQMTERGIPVFNTPGANANAVKELVLCGLLLGSRRIVDGINHMKDLGSQGLAKERVEKDKSMFGGRELVGKTLAVIGMGHIGAATARDAARLGMVIVGYDPSLSIQSALMLPRRPMTIADSLVGAVTGADYVSINIPYIKGSPKEGGTHNIIDAEVVQHFKSDAVVLNFARGELVHSGAMKEFLDRGDGRYVSDFPDDELWDHKNAIILPHLGASTEEAEDEAAGMAADTIQNFLETGTIKNSVNFPNTALPDRKKGAIRFTVVNKNAPGTLALVLDEFAKANLNIAEMINQSRGSIAYNVLDIESNQADDSSVTVLDMKDVQERITMLDGILSSRIIYGTFGAGYAKNLDGEYFV